MKPRGIDMSGGCYRCGLAEGSADRLCESCFRMKFHRGREIVDLPPDTPIEGLELSPKMRTVLLSSGAALYASLIGFVVAAHVMHAKTYGDPRLKFVTNDVGHSTVTVKRVLQLVEAPDRFARHGASSETSG